MSGLLTCGRNMVIVNSNDCNYYYYPSVNPAFSFFRLLLMNFVRKRFSEDVTVWVSPSRGWLGSWKSDPEDPNGASWRLR